MVMLSGTDNIVRHKCAELAGLNHCAVFFLRRADANLCWGIIIAKRNKTMII